MRYAIFDPTGNITLLVEDEVAPQAQPEVAASLMRRHPDVEQVGFVRREGGGVRLRMAGGEFCGNASMCAAAWHVLERGGAGAGQEAVVRLGVSGARDAVEVRLEPTGTDAFRAEIKMPPALGVERVELRHGELAVSLPVVRMQGISHVVVDAASAAFWLLGHRRDAEQAVRAWCERLRADGLGLMFLEGRGAARRLLPLVYVPSSGTVFWENSCASGSAAVGTYLARRAGRAVELALAAPGGTLRVRSDPAQGRTWLTGAVRLVSRHDTPGPATGE